MTVSTSGKPLFISRIQFWRILACLLFILNLTGGLMAWWLWPRAKTIKLDHYQTEQSVGALDPFVFKYPVAEKVEMGFLIDIPQIRITPEVQGQFRWISANKLQFFPEKKLIPATRYTVQFLDEFASEYNGKWRGADEIRFQTPRLKLQHGFLHEVLRNPDNIEETWLRIEFMFNYSVDPNVLLEHLKIHHPDHGNISYELNQYGPSSSFELLTSRFSQPPVSEVLQIHIAKDLIPFKGELPMTSNISEGIVIHTPADLVVQGLFSQNPGGRNAIRLTFNKPVDAGLAADFISVEPDIPNLRIIQSNTSLLLKGDIKFQAYYSVKVKEGLMALDGAVLKIPFDGTVHIKDLNPSVAFASQGTFLMRSGGRQLKLLTVNVPQVDFKVHRVYHNNLVQWLHRVNRSPDLRNTQIHTIGHRLFKEKLEVKSNQNEQTATFFNIDDFIEDERGIYSFTVNNTSQRWRQSTQWVVLTDLGIMCKKTRDELWVWVHSLTDTRPVSGVRIELYSTTNQLMVSGITDRNGRAVLSGIHPDSEEFKPFVIVAEKEGDLSFLNLSRHKISETNFDISGRPYLENGFDAFMYTDRGIYRPGDTARLIGILRQGRQLRTPNPLPVILKIKTPDQGLYSEHELWLSSEGMFELDIPFPLEALTGKYTVNLELGGDVLNSVQLSVEEFLPDRIKVMLDVAADTLALADTLRGSVKGRMLFGPPAAGKKVRVNVKVEETPFTPSRFRDFKFSDSRRSYTTREFSIHQGELDDEGCVPFQYRIPAEIQPASDLRGIVSANVTESGGRTVSSYAGIRLSAYDHYVGLKALDSRPRHGKPVQFQIVSVNPDGTPAPGRALNIKAYRIHYHWTSRYHSDRYHWESQKEYQEVFTDQIVSGEGPVPYQLTLQDWGSYLVEVSDPVSGMSTTHQFWMSGYGSQNWNAENPDRLEIELDQETYQAGESAEIQIKSPFPGRLLLTLESDRILESRAVEMTENTTRLTLPVHGEYAPNIYISASVIRSPLNLQEHEHARAHGVAPLTVIPNQQPLEIILNCPEKIRPQEELTVFYDIPNADNVVQLTIAGVDEGILQLIDFETPDPFGFFYAKRGIGTETMDIYSELLPEYNTGNPDDKAGGDAARKLQGQKYLSTSGIQRIKPVVLWSGLIESDVMGSGQVSFRIPQFDGELRLMAVAAAGNRFGHAERSVLIRDPIVLTPTFPRFAAGGDRFVIPTEVFNATGSDGEFTIQLETGPGIQLQDASAYTAFIEADQQIMLEFPVTADIGLQPVDVRLTASGNGFNVQRSESIPLRPPWPVATRSWSGVATGNQNLEIRFDDQWYPGTTEFHLHVSGLPDLKLSKSLQYLLKYPHGCAEQTVSRLFPLLYFEDLALALEPELFSSGSADYFINEGIRKLERYQRTDGSFSYWRNSVHFYPWASLYVAHFLVEARNAGYEVSEHILETSLEWCESIARFGGGSYSRKYLQNRIYANYIITLAGRADRNTINYLKNFELDALPLFSRYQLAGCYAGIGDMVTARGLIPNFAEIPRPDPPAHMHTPVRAYSIMLDVLTDLDPDHPQIKTLLEKLNQSMEKTGRWYNTQANAFALMAMGKYLHHHPVGEKPVGTIVLPDGESVALDGTDLHLQSRDWAGKLISINLDNNSEAYAYWIAAGIPLEDQTQAIESGISLTREFYNEQGQIIHDLRFMQGELVVVKVNLKSTGENLQDVIMVDMLPAGFQVENVRLSSRQQIPWIDAIRKKDQPQLMDYRDDRVILATDLPVNHYNRRTREYGKVFYYALRAVTVGEFTLPAITAEAMYDPAKNAVVPGARIEIVQPVFYPPPAGEQ